MSARARIVVRGEASGGPTLVLAHGAGAGSAHPWMTRVADGLAARGLRVVTFDFPYVEAGRRLPDKMDALCKRFEEVVGEVSRTCPGAPISLAGKSMGGRVASHVAAECKDPIASLVFFGYPLHPPSRPENRRDAHLAAVSAPMLFVSGQRDPFGGEDEIRQLAGSLRARVHIVPQGDHSLGVPKRAPDGLEAALDAAADHVLSHSALRAPRRIA